VGREECLDLPEVSPELIVRAERADAQRILGYAATADETGLPIVTGTGIETRDTLASGRPGSTSSGLPRPWIGQNEMWSTSLCLASSRHSRQMNPLRSVHAIVPPATILATNPGER
jgi:hypothetical protein